METQNDGCILNGQIFNPQSPDGVSTGQISNFKFYRSERREKIPNFKFQIPNKSQFSISSFEFPFSNFQDNPVLHRLQGFNNFLVGGEAEFFFLGENEHPVGFHFEDPTGGFNELRLEVEFLFNRFCQTGSFGVVVSFHAVFNADSFDHGFLLVFVNVLFSFKRFRLHYRMQR